MKRFIPCLLILVTLLSACASSSSEPVATPTNSEKDSDFAEFQLPVDWPTDVPLPDSAQLAIKEPMFQVSRFGEPGDQLQTVDGSATMIVEGTRDQVYSDFSRKMKQFGFKCAFESDTSSGLSCTFESAIYSVTAFFLDASSEIPTLDGFTIVILAVEYLDGAIEVK